MERLNEFFDRLLAVVAHPDDLEYGASSALVGWSAAGKQVGYVIVTDGEAGIDLRTSIAREIRRFRPDVLLTATQRLTFGGRRLNQADHRRVALAVLDAAKDAGNRSFRTALGDAAPHTGVRSVLLMGSSG